MTQQNETQQSAEAPGQPGRSPEPAAQPASAARPDAAGTPESAARPPSLFGYEALPEAYLAPPQPGQPRYGTSAGLASSRPFAGRPGYGEPGSDNRTNRQTGNGRPAPVRTTTGAAAQRDPVLAAPWQRFAAQAIDWIIIIGTSVLAFSSTLFRVWREMQAVSSSHSDLTSPPALAAISSIERANQNAVLYWYLGIFGIAVAYFWVQHAAWGATIGKRAMGMRVVRAADRSRIGVLTAGIRTVAFLVGPAIFLLLAYPANVVGGILWAADDGLPLLDSRAQSLHDKLAGTVVVRQRALDEQTRRSSTW